LFNYAADFRPDPLSHGRTVTLSVYHAEAFRLTLSDLFIALANATMKIE
jgi:hypothetical protein